MKKSKKAKTLLAVGIVALLSFGLTGCERTIIIKEEKSYEERCIVQLSAGPIDLCKLGKP